MEFLVRHRLILAFAALSFAALLYFWCSKGQGKAEKNQEKILASATSPMADSIRFQYAVYFLPGSSNDAQAVFHKILPREYLTLKSVDKIPERTEEAVVYAHVQKNVQREYVPPDMKHLEYSGHG